MGSINHPYAQTRNDLCVNADSLSPSLVASALFLRIFSESYTSFHVPTIQGVHGYPFTFCPSSVCKIIFSASSSSSCSPMKTLFSYLPPLQAMISNHFSTEVTSGNCPSFLNIIFNICSDAQFSYA